MQGCPASPGAFSRPAINSKPHIKSQPATKLQPTAKSKPTATSKLGQTSHGLGFMDPGAPFLVPLGNGTKSKHRQSPSLCGSPSPCRVSTQTAKGPYLLKSSLNLKLLLDTWVRSSVKVKESKIVLIRQITAKAEFLQNHLGEKFQSFKQFAQKKLFNFLNCFMLKKLCNGFFAATDA